MVARRLLLLPLVVACFAFAACGGGTDKATPAAPSTSAAVAAAAPSPTPSTPAARPRVSLATSCQLLFPDSGDKGPLSDMLAVVVEDSIGQRQINTAQSGVDTATDIVETAQPKLAEQLQVLIDETTGIIADLRNFGTTTTDSGAIKAAGLEVTHICLDVL